MVELSIMDLIGAWVSIFLTLAVLSFLYDDNPIYKITEHLFMGIAIGYGVVEAYWNLLKPNLQDRLVSAAQGDTLNWVYLVPLALSVLLLLKVSRRYSWLARIPIAFLVASYAAVKITGETSGKLIKQLGASFPNMSETWTKHGVWDWSADGAGVFSDVFLVLGLSACLLHFYFSEVPEKAKRFGVPMGSTVAGLTFCGAFAFSPLDDLTGRLVVALGLSLCAGAPLLILSRHKTLLSRFGIIVLMLSFGASFGFTVMGRISLAIGRAQELLGLDRPVEEVAQVQPGYASLLSLILIIGILLYFKRRSNETEPTSQAPETQ